MRQRGRHCDRWRGRVDRWCNDDFGGVSDRCRGGHACGAGFEACELAVCAVDAAMMLTQRLDLSR